RAGTPPGPGAAGQRQRLRAVRGAAAALAPGDRRPPRQRLRRALVRHAVPARLRAAEAARDARLQHPGARRGLRLVPAHRLIRRPEEPTLSDTPYPPSWYADSATHLAPLPALEGDVEADVCILGAGYAGLTAALELAEGGQPVVVLEARRVGWGGAGGNGGHALVR